MSGVAVTSHSGAGAKDKFIYGARSSERPGNSRSESAIPAIVTTRTKKSAPTGASCTLSPKWRDSVVVRTQFLATIHTG